MGLNLKKLIEEIEKRREKEIGKLLREYLYDKTNCISIEEARRECEKKRLRKKKK